MTKQQRPSSSAVSTATETQDTDTPASQQSAETFASHFQKSSAANQKKETDVGDTSSALGLFKGKKAKADARPTTTTKASKEDANDNAPVSPAPGQQVTDPRSWLLSWQNGQTAAGTGTTPATADGKAEGAVQPPAQAPGALKDMLRSGAPDAAEAHALQRTQIAFSVTIPSHDASPATTPQVETKPNAATLTALTPAAPKATDSGSSVKAEPAGVTSKTNVPKDEVGADKTGTPAISKPSAKDNNSKHSSDKGHSNTADKDDNISAASSSKTREERDAQAGAVHSGTSSVHAADSSAAATSATASTGTPQHVASAYTASKTDSAPTTSQASSVSDDPKPTTIAKPQSIDLKVGTQDGEQVDVRVSQRAGDVQVTVRTADGQLAQSLRHHLPELSDRLAQNGVQGDFWQPSASQSSSAHSDGDTQEFSDRNDSQSQGQQGKGGNRSSDPEGENKRQSAWLNEMNKAEPRN